MTDFEQLYKTYFSDVYHYVRMLCKNDALAEEITCETFFRAMSSVRSFRGTGSPYTWLCQIAKNCYFSHLKKEKRLSSIECFKEFVSPYPPIEDQWIKKERSLELHALLHELPEPYKEVFQLRVFGELSFRQIGKLFNRTENWACVVYYRARKKIQTKLEETDHDTL